MNENSMMEEKISVVIPLYNKAPHIKRTLNSVFNQTYQPLEIIVVDDGSTDGGGEIVASLKNPLVRLIRQDNGGVSAARNRGIDEAKGKYIAFLDADDEWLPEFLSEIQKMFAMNNTCGIYGTSYVVTKANLKSGLNRDKSSLIKIISHQEDFLKLWLEGLPFYTSSVVIPKKILKDVNGFPNGVSMGEDLETWMKIGLKYPVIYSMRKLVFYNQFTANSLCKNSLLFTEELPFLKFSKKLLNDETLSSKSKKNLSKVITETRNFQVRKLIINGYSINARIILQNNQEQKDYVWYLLMLLSFVPFYLLKVSVKVALKIRKKSW